MYIYIYIIPDPLGWPAAGAPAGFGAASGMAREEATAAAKPVTSSSTIGPVERALKAPCAPK